jgi:small subunit ribosomal protein S2
MSPFIYTKRNGIHIIDLQLTTKFIDVVHSYVQELITAGKNILFIGTKKQAQDAIREEATKCGMPYVASRWPGGLLTNRNTMQKRIERLRELRKQKEDGYLDELTKKDAKFLNDEMEKLEKSFGGIADLDGLPDALFIIDVKKEENAVREAKKLNIPIIGILDTNCNPEDVDYKLPGNDDAIRSIRLFCQIISDSVMEAKYGYLPPDSVFIRAAEDQAEEKQSEDRGTQKASVELPVDDPAAPVAAESVDEQDSVTPPVAAESVDEQDSAAPPVAEVTPAEEPAELVASAGPVVVEMPVLESGSVESADQPALDVDEQTVVEEN